MADGTSDGRRGSRTGLGADRPSGADGPSRETELPAISMVTPSYQQARFLGAALRSVLEQDYPRLEYLVQDGGSTDGSVEVIERHADGIDHWRSGPDEGQADAVNRGWRRATGEVLGWLNSDDLLEPGALRAVGEAFARRPETRLLFGDCRVVDEAGEEIRVKRPADFDVDALLEGRSLPQPSVFLRRGLAEELGGLDASLRYALDWAFFLRAFLRCREEEILYLPRCLSASRVYEGTKSRTGLANKGEERRRVLRELRDAGELDGLPPGSWRRAVGGSWWIQASDQWLAGRPLEAAASALRALVRDPVRGLSQLPSAGWWMRERRHRRAAADREDGGTARGGSACP